MTTLNFKKKGKTKKKDKTTLRLQDISLPFCRAKNSFRNVLSSSFYKRPTLEVATELLGKTLVVSQKPHLSLQDPRTQLTAGRIIEVEAYLANDPAAHCVRGKTSRCAPMFETPGRAYVYFIYGFYEMLNVVTEKKSIPGAVLIRALEPVFGFHWIKKRRPHIAPAHWTNGPGKLTKAMRILRHHNRASFQGPELFLLNTPAPYSKIATSSRVGIQAGKEHFWRFFFPDSPFLSPVPQNLHTKSHKR